MNGLVLSGGGGRGPYEYGVYKALHAAGVRFDVLAGTSVGAITAAAVASGMSFAEMDELWRRMGTFRIMHPRVDVWRFPTWTHLVDSAPLRRFLARHLDLEAARASEQQVRVTAVDVATGELKVFRNEELSLDALLASSAIPLLFPMVEIEGRRYWDGGAVANTPIVPAIDAGATDIYTVLLSPLGARRLPPPSNLWEAVTRLTDLQLLGNLKEDIKRAEAVNRLVAEGRAAPGRRHVDFHVISPEDGLGIVTLFNFAGAKAEELIAWGEGDGRRFLASAGVGESRVEEMAAHEEKG